MGKGGQERPKRSRPPSMDSGSETETGSSVKRRGLSVDSDGVESRSRDSSVESGRSQKGLRLTFLKPRPPKEGEGGRVTVVPAGRNFCSLEVRDTRQDALELRKMAGQSMAAIKDVALKSGNLKGTHVRALKDAVEALGDIIDALASRSESDEVKRTWADNARLRRELELARQERKALRREFEAMRKDRSSARVDSLPPSSTYLEEMLADLKAYIATTVGAMVNARVDARIDGIDHRLLPDKVVRPPLAADRKRAAQEQPVAAPRASQPALPKPSQPSQPAESKGKGKNKGKGKGKGKATPPAPVPPPPPAAPAVSAPPVEPVAGPSRAPDTWATVVKGKGKGKKPSPPAAAKKAPTPAPRASAKPAAAPAKTGKAKPTLKAPDSAAVILTLQPEAATRGITYSEVLTRAREAVDLSEVGLGPGMVTIRRTAMGSRILEIPKSQGPEKANVLAGRLRTALDGVASVSCPTKTADIKVVGLDDSATKEMVAAAIAKTGACSAEQVKVTAIGTGPGGMGTCIVVCPVVAAKAVIAAGKILVGWSSARIQALEQRPMRCHKCMGLGHTWPRCPSKADRSKLCYRCGDEGHRGADCAAKKLRCAICAESGRPSGHVMGGRSCAPPSIKGRDGTGARAAPSATGDGRQAPMDFEVSQ